MQASNNIDAEALKEAEANLKRTTVRHDLSTERYSESSTYYKQAHAVEETILQQPKVSAVFPSMTLILEQYFPIVLTNTSCRMEGD